MDEKLEVIEPKSFSEAVADEIVACVQEAISERGRASLSLAGGSTPGAVYRVLGRPPRVNEIDWSKVHIYWGDERWVPHDDMQSNFKMVQETLLSNLPKPGPKVNAVNTSLSSAEESAVAYAKTIAQNEKGASVPILDIVLLGIGEDGHTASIFPNSSVVSASGTIAHAVKHPSDGGYRVTLSPDVLFSARKILFIVNGDSKAPIMKRVLKGSESEIEIPAKLYRKAKERVTFFLDCTAAKELG